MPGSVSIIELGNPQLRQVSEAIPDPKDPVLQRWIDTLLTTMQQENGVGIAAPQMGKVVRLFVVASRPTLRYPQAPAMEPTVMINPRMLSHSDEMEKDWEGCLSVPGLRGRVPRYRAIAVEYTGRDGNQYQQELTGFVARIFQHELDHLDGLVFLDRVETVLDLISEQEYYAQVLSPLDHASAESSLAEE